MKKILIERLQSKILKKSKKNLDLSNLPQAKIKTILDFEGKRNIILFGDTGVGKTTLMETFIDLLECELNIEPFTRIKAEQMIACLRNEEGYILSGKHHVQNLFIDDVGREKPKYVVYGETIIPFSEIMYVRDELDSPLTFITTTMNPVELKNRYGSSTISRLAKDSIFLEIKGKDFRLC